MAKKRKILTLFYEPCHMKYKTSNVVFLLNYDKKPLHCKCICFSFVVSDIILLPDN